jgi:hypothetical protein
VCVGGDRKHISTSFCRQAVLQTKGVASVMPRQKEVMKCRELNSGCIAFDRSRFGFEIPVLSPGSVAGVERDGPKNG